MPGGNSGQRSCYEKAWKTANPKDSPSQMDPFTVAWEIGSPKSTDEESCTKARGPEGDPELKSQRKKKKVVDGGN